MYWPHRLVLTGLILFVGSAIGMFRVPRDEIAAWLVLAAVGAALVLLGVRMTRRGTKDE
jgi:hypothetical protein